jgi:hypothetical protein
MDKDYTRLSDTRKVVFDVRVAGQHMTYINCPGERAKELLSQHGAVNVQITPKVVRGL